MKIRTDFVTNSSSSSFMIAIKGVKDVDKELENCSENIKAMVQMFKKIFVDGNEKIEDEKTLASYYGYDSIEDMKNDYSEDFMETVINILDYINKDYTIVSTSVEYGCEDIYETVAKFADGENFVILDRN